MIQKTIAFLFFVISFSIHSQPNELMNRFYIANQNINNLIPNKITESKSVVPYLIDNKNKVIYKEVILESNEDRISIHSNKELDIY